MRQTRSVMVTKAPTSESSTEDRPKVSRRLVLVKNAITQKPSLRSFQISSSQPSRTTQQKTSKTKAQARVANVSVNIDQNNVKKLPAKINSETPSQRESLIELKSLVKTPSSSADFHSMTTRKIDTGRPNVLKGGLLENRNARSNVSIAVSNRGDCVPHTPLQRKLSDKILAHRTKFLKDCAADFCSSSNQATFQHPLLEDGKKVLKKTQRMTMTSLKSGATKSLLEKLNQPLITKNTKQKTSYAIPNTKASTNLTLIRTTELSTPGVVQVKPSVRIIPQIPKKSIIDPSNPTTKPDNTKTCTKVIKSLSKTSSGRDKNNNMKVETGRNTKIPKSDLSRIQLSAAKIKDIMDDPLVINETGILSQIANPNNDITPKTLAKLLGEKEQKSMHALMETIKNKVNRSKRLVPLTGSVDSLQTESESVTFSEAENPSENLSVDVNNNLHDNGKVFKKNRKLKKPSKKNKLTHSRKSGSTHFSNFNSNQNVAIDSQLKECLDRQESLESQVSDFIERMREKTLKSRASTSNDTLETLESLVKTQKEIINIQIDLRKRYGVEISSSAVQQPQPQAYNGSVQTYNSSIGRTHSRLSTSSEPILNPYNLHYGQLASYAREIDGKIAFYCSTCNVACENEMKFRLHLESASHVAKAYKVLQQSQPLYNCEDCKTKIQGTTQFLAHVTGKNHLRNTKSNINVAMDVLEKKPSGPLPKTTTKMFKREKN